MQNSTAEADGNIMGPCNGTSSTQTETSEFSTGVLVLLGLLMVLLALVTVLGNVLVILAFIMDRNLRHRSNYFFLNLAISDFAVGKLQCWKCSICFLVMLKGGRGPYFGVWCLLGEILPNRVPWGTVRNVGNCIKRFNSLLCLKI